MGTELGGRSPSSPLFPAASLSSPSHLIVLKSSPLKGSESGSGRTLSSIHAPTTDCFPFPFLPPLPRPPPTLPCVLCLPISQSIKLASVHHCFYVAQPADVTFGPSDAQLGAAVRERLGRFHARGSGAHER